MWVGNLDASITANELLALFSPYGPIESLRVLPDKECAFINFQCLDDAIRAKDDMQGGRMGSLNIRIGFGKADPTYATASADMQTSQPTRALCNLIYRILYLITFNNIIIRDRKYICFHFFCYPSIHFLQFWNCRIRSGASA